MKPLITIDMKRYSIAVATGFLFSLIPFSGHSQNVGIGTVNPTAKLHVSDGSFLAESAGTIPVAPPDPPVSGAGRRIMWYPAKAAFRAGYVVGTQWDKSNVGNYSVAFGYDNIASGNFSFAANSNNTASGLYATAMGALNTSSGLISFALGYDNTASGDHSFATNHDNTASGENAVAMGNQSEASAKNSVAIGSKAKATAVTAIAIGSDIHALAYRSIAIGSNMSTGNFAGSCVIGDDAAFTITSTEANQFTSRFVGGYRFFTSSSTAAYLNANQNSWSTTSDSTKKENFLHADGAAFLAKIKNLRLGSWNYKGQDKTSLRHYGPMAQEFYAAFGHDGIGTIGTDTSITTADIDGVMMIAIKQLILENEELKAENKRMISQSATLLQRLEILEAKAQDNLALSAQKP